MQACYTAVAYNIEAREVSYYCLLLLCDVGHLTLRSAVVRTVTLLYAVTPSLLASSFVSSTPQHIRILLSPRTLSVASLLVQSLQRTPSIAPFCSRLAPPHRSSSWSVGAAAQTRLQPRHSLTSVDQRCGRLGFSHCSSLPHCVALCVFPSVCCCYRVCVCVCVRVCQASADVLYQVDEQQTVIRHLLTTYSSRQYTSDIQATAKQHSTARQEPTHRRTMDARMVVAEGEASDFTHAVLPVSCLLVSGCRERAARRARLPLPLRPLSQLLLLRPTN